MWVDLKIRPHKLSTMEKVVSKNIESRVINLQNILMIQCRSFQHGVFYLQPCIRKSDHLSRGRILNELFTGPEPPSLVLARRLVP